MSIKIRRQSLAAAAEQTVSPEDPIRHRPPKRPASRSDPTATPQKPLPLLPLCRNGEADAHIEAIGGATLSGTLVLNDGQFNGTD